jgi:hypothetical protein
MVKDVVCEIHILASLEQRRYAERGIMQNAVRCTATPMQPFLFGQKPNQ